MNTKILLCTALLAAVLAPAVAVADDTTKTAEPVVTDAELAILAHFRHVNMMEIDMGKVAMKQTKNKKVRAFGKALVTDHTKALKAADAFVKANKLTLPVDTGKDEAETKQMQADMEAMEKMKTLSGVEFDRAFLPAMADGHTKEIDKLDLGLPAVTNAKLKAIFEKARPAIVKHAETAKKLDAEVQRTATATSTTTTTTTTK